MTLRTKRESNGVRREARLKGRELSGEGGGGSLPNIFMHTSTSTIQNCCYSK